MKRTTLMFAIAISMSVFLSSCKHDYECRCTVAGVTNTEEWDNVKLKDKDDYKKQCDEDHQDAQSLGGSCEFREN
jgi:hypothetical protein